MTTPRITVKLERGCSCPMLYVAYIDGRPVAWGRTEATARELADAAELDERDAPASWPNEITAGLRRMP